MGKKVSRMEQSIPQDVYMMI